MSSPASAQLKVNVSASIGLVAGGVTALLAPWQLAVLVGWDAAATVKLVWVWVSIHGLDPAQTHEMATFEDDSRTTATVVVVAACVVSLVGSILALHKARQVSTRLEVALTVLSISAVALSWCLVHTMFALRYAHLYYSGSVGGIDFGDEAPDYRDFGYVAFTTGMTFQVSDTRLRSRPIRRTLTRHALVSYVFSTVIVGLTINVMAGIVR